MTRASTAGWREPGRKGPPRKTLRPPQSLPVRRHPAAPGDGATAFTLTLVNHTPPTASQDPDAVAAALLRDIGYLPGGLEVPPLGAGRRRGRPRLTAVQGPGACDPARPGAEVLDSTPYRLMVGCLLARPHHAFTIEELERELGASRPTIYRHLNKLRDLELLSHGDGGDDGGDATSGGTSRRRRYGLRFGSLGRAWRFTELGAECALEGLRERVDLVWREWEGRRHARAKEGRAGGDGAVRDMSQSHVSFRLVVRELGRPDPTAPAEAKMRDLMLAIGYLSEGRAPEADEGAGESVAWRLLQGCLVERCDRTWTVEQLMARLDASKPTVYRHLRKLEGLDVLERTLVGGTPRSPKGMRLRFGDLSVAWNFTEEHAKSSLAAYRETVAHLEHLMEGRSRGGGAGEADR